MSHHIRHIGRARQSGVTLLITLIVLVAMTLATLALMRSVDTTNIIAGNLAFQRTTQLAADAGTEAAINVTLYHLIDTGQMEILDCPAGFGYRSYYQPNLDPPNQTWERYWDAVKACAITLPEDPLGNTVAYVIERLCNDNTTGGCMESPSTPETRTCEASNVGNANLPCPPNHPSLFRITTRTQGPRNTISYIQSIIAM